MACGDGPAAGTHAVSDLTWTSAVNGWGPVEKDMSNGEQAPGDGGPITIQGVKYSKGLGTNAYSEVVYYLGGTCTNVSTDVGVDDEAGPRGSVTFEIYRDGTKVAGTGLMRWLQPAQHLSADLTGANELRLVVTDGGDGNTSDHADWAAPQLTCS
nr:NPCBM/NEW2 domain-containing protein [Kitasatospora sp. MAP5-34]